MFGESSLYYDLIYEAKGYAEEARRIMALLPEGTEELLDVACGTGEHHRFLRDHLQVHGVDFNPTFLDMARAKNPDGHYQQGDMRNFSLGRTFPAVTCLFGSIGYCQTSEELRSALGCLAAHLAPGGTLLLEPWITPEDWKPGRIFSQLHKREGLEICRMSHSRREGRQSVMDFEYLVGETGKGVRHFSEQHRMGLFSQAETVALLQQLGLTTELDPAGLMGRGLHIARRPRL